LKKCVYYFLFVFLFLPTVIFGGFVLGKYGGAFLETGVGARALGMGGAYVAVASDATAIYWNPAGLVSLKTIQVHGMHSERFAGIVNRDFAGVGIPLGERLTLGFGFVRLGVDGIPFTDVRDPSRSLGEIYIDESGRRVRNDPFVSKYVNDSETAFIFSFAKRNSARFSCGGNVKVIRKSVGEYGAWGIGFDFGVLFNPYRSLKIGAVLLDGTSTLIAWDSGQRELISPRLKTGAAYQFKISTLSVLPVFDVETTFENRGSAVQAALGRLGFDFRSGLEIGFKNRIAMRVGLNRGSLTAGAGFMVSAVRVDYGFSQHFDLGNTHRISITLFWDRKRFLQL